MFNNMPNQNFCGPRDDMSLVNCDLTKSYKSCQPSEKLCRFAYASWCPVCDLDSHRRRSRSECIDSHYRKRGRDMKTPSPQKKDSSENEEFVDVRDRLDSSRVRTNLCELPTTYITNCQTNVPSNVDDDDDATYSIKFSNFVEPLYDNRAHVTLYTENSHQKAMNSIRNGDILKKNGYSKYHYLSSHKIEKPIDNNIRSNSLDNKNSSRSKVVHDSIPHETCTNQFIKVKEISPKHYGDVLKHSVCSENEQINTKRQLPVPKLSPKTTMYHKICNSEKILLDTADEIGIKSNENKSETSRNEHIEDALDVKRHRVRQRSDHDDLTSAKQKESGSSITKKAREISPLENKKDLRSKSAVKVASIKNRHRLSAIKLRKVRSKIAHSVSSDSNLSSSDCNESEDEEKSENCELYEETANSINGSTPNNKYIPGADLEDLEKWPLRPSLFPHIPPYISFSAHDGEAFELPPGVARYLKWKLSTITPVVVRKTLSNTGFRLVRKSNDWIGTWGKHIKSVCFQSLKESQKLNHFPGTFQIGRKDRLWKNLQRLMFKYGQKEFGFIPRTYVLPNDLKLLRQAWERTGNEKWIIKPPASARGTGIKVIHRWAHLPKKKSLVVQQYISNPYLINGSKFDLRLYVLVTSFNPLRIYLYPDGLARFASTKYSDDLSTLSDRYMHLTNYSINKLSSQYTANEDANACKGHKWTLSKLWEYLENEGINTKSIWRSLQQLVIKTILCGESSISQLYKANINSRYNCYELFGIDVLLDERLKPWLLEVNISPSLHSASPLDLHVKGPLVQSLLNLAQFHLPPKIIRLQNAPPYLNSSLYSTQLTTKERLKQIHFTEFEKRDEYLADILDDLTGDDIRHLTQAEDELTVTGNFERIFPTQHSHYYFQFMEVRYYNRLFDAWENRYEKHRSVGIKLLQTLCEKKLHLEIGPSPTIKKLSEEIEGTSSPEASTSEDSAQLTITKRPQTSPAPAIADPTINAIKREIQFKMMNLKLGGGRSVSPF